MVRHGWEMSRIFFVPFMYIVHIKKIHRKLIFLFVYIMYLIKCIFYFKDVFICNKEINLLDISYKKLNWIKIKDIFVDFSPFG